MPLRPPRRCPGCHQLVDGSCRTCSRQTSRRRGTRQEQGYDEDWLRLRQWHLAGNPLCLYCERNGRLTPADQVHHRDPFATLEDPRRLDPDNLESVCISCHAKITRACKVNVTQTGVSHHGDTAPAKRGQGSFLAGQDRDWGIG